MAGIVPGEFDGGATFFGDGVGVARASFPVRLTMLLLAFQFQGWTLPVRIS